MTTFEIITLLLRLWSWEPYSQFLKYLFGFDNYWRTPMDFFAILIKVLLGYTYTKNILFLLQKLWLQEAKMWYFWFRAPKTDYPLKEKSHKNCVFFIVLFNQFQSYLSTHRKVYYFVHDCIYLLNGRIFRRYLGNKRRSHTHTEKYFNGVRDTYNYFAFYWKIDGFQLCI